MAALSICISSAVSPVCSRLPAKRIKSSSLSRNSKSQALHSTFCGVRLNKQRSWTKNKASPCFGKSSSSKQLLATCARLFGPAMFEAAKLRVLVLLSKESDERQKILKEEEVEFEQPRVYTLTHSDLTAQIFLTVARAINDSQLQGWYKRLQRDEVLAEWRRTKGVMALHVHCHISGGTSVFLHALIARLRFKIFRKELPVVLEAFRVGDEELFRSRPELNFAPVWVYFHSSNSEFSGVEYWGTLAEAINRKHNDSSAANQASLLRELPIVPCSIPCLCCSREARIVNLLESRRALVAGDRAKE